MAVPAESKAVELLSHVDTVVEKRRHWFDDYKESELLPGSIVESYVELHDESEDPNDD